MTAERALRWLPDWERAVIYLDFYSRLPRRQIAKRLSVSKVRVTDLRTHALARMRMLLEHGEADLE